MTPDLKRRGKPPNCNLYLTLSSKPNNFFLEETPFPPPIFNLGLWFMNCLILFVLIRSQFTDVLCISAVVVYPSVHCTDLFHDVYQSCVKKADNNRLVLLICRSIGPFWAFPGFSRYDFPGFSFCFVCDFFICRQYRQFSPTNKSNLNLQ